MHQPHNEQGICCQGRFMFFRACNCSCLKAYAVLPPAVGCFITLHLFDEDKCSLSLLQQVEATAFLMSWHAFFLSFWTMCSLHNLPVGSVCFWLLLCSVFFLPAELDIVSRPFPSLLSFCGSLSQSRRERYTPHFLLTLPPGGATSEDTLYWRLCQNKNPQRGRRGAGRVMSGCLHCLVLCTVALFFFFLLFLSKMGVDLTTYLDFLELPFCLNMKSTFFLFMEGKKILK